MSYSPRFSTPTTCQAGDDCAKDCHDAADDGLEDGTDAGYDGHYNTADGLEHGFNLLGFS